MPSASAGSTSSNVKTSALVTSFPKHLGVVGTLYVNFSKFESGVFSELFNNIYKLYIPLSLKTKPLERDPIQTHTLRTLKEIPLIFITKARDFEISKKIDLRDTRAFRYNLPILFSHFGFIN